MCKIILKFTATIVTLYMILFRFVLLKHLNHSNQWQIKKLKKKKLSHFEIKYKMIEMNKKKQNHRRSND